MPSIIERIDLFNQGHDHNLLARKYELMSVSAFAFLRGTCHLFYEDWHAKAPASLNETPIVWICGDLHTENFGSYKGDNRLVYFDINDFDESVLAPCTWDVARMLTSVTLVGQTLPEKPDYAPVLRHAFLDAYTTVFAKGRVRSVEQATATGLVAKLLNSLDQRNRAAFVAKRTVFEGKQRRLKIRKGRTRKANKQTRSRIIGLMDNWRAEQSNPEFYRVLDIAHREAGTGSLGLENYVLLVEGKGSPDNNYLLALKQAVPSSLSPYLQGSAQPAWSSEAERIVTNQCRIQGTPPARLDTVVTESGSYVLQELQPTRDRVQLSDPTPRPRAIQELMVTLGEIVAWDQLRSTGRQGSAIADDLVAFGKQTDWQQPLLDYVANYAQQVISDYEEFCAARTPSEPS